MLGNNKNVFWEALLLAAVIFILGIFLGIAFEANRVDDIAEVYEQSSISLTDSFALRELVSEGDYSCEELIDFNLEFADTIYEEAKTLEQYDSAERITDGLNSAHRRYDLLRTLLWMNLRDLRQECGDDFNSVIYIYEYNSEDLNKKATQAVWSRVLSDLKRELGGEVILVPIAGDSNLISLSILLKDFGILDVSGMPVVIVNDEFVLDDVSSVEDIKNYL